MSPAQLGSRSIAERVVADEPEFLVINKPAGVLVHPKKPDAGPTVWSELVALYGYELANGGQLSIINRLDRETSGIMLVAKTGATAADLHRQAAHRRIKKFYQAIVLGWPDWQETECIAPLLRSGSIGPSRIWLKRAVHPQGAPAQTRFVVVDRFCRRQTRFAQILCQPVTGRTHQIRVHLAYLGFPIVGDKIYGVDETVYLRFIASGWTPALAKLVLLPRHALHATALEFGLAGRDYRFEAPFPDDLRSFLMGSRAGAAAVQPRRSGQQDES